MKPMQEPFSDEPSFQGGKPRRNLVSDIDLDDLREHVDTISFNIGKVYQHARDRSRKQSIRNSMRKRFHHTHKNEKSGY